MTDLACSLVNGHELQAAGPVPQKRPDGRTSNAGFAVRTADGSVDLALYDCPFYAVMRLRPISNATASRPYTCDIHNSSVVGLFMTPVGQWKRLDRVMVECTCLLHIAPL